MPLLHDLPIDQDMSPLDLMKVCRSYRASHHTSSTLYSLTPNNGQDIMRVEGASTYTTKRAGFSSFPSVVVTSLTFNFSFEVPPSFQNLFFQGLGAAMEGKQWETIVRSICGTKDPIQLL